MLITSPFRGAIGFFFSQQRNSIFVGAQKTFLSSSQSYVFPDGAVSGAKSNQDLNLRREYRWEKKPSNTRYRRINANPVEGQYGGIVKSASRKMSVGRITMIIARKKSRHCHRITRHFGTRPLRQRNARRSSLREVGKGNSEAPLFPR